MKTLARSSSRTQPARRVICSYAALFLLCIALVGRDSASAEAAAPGLSAHSRLVFRTVAGYAHAVSGRGWKPGARLRLVVRSNLRAGAIRLRANPPGQFLIGINRTGCDLRVDAYDGAGHHAVLVVPPPICHAIQADAPPPILTVLKGTPLTAHEVRVYWSKPVGANSVTLRRGDYLYFWEPGATRPMFDVHADASYLTLHDQGITPPRACPQPDCAAGFYWRWVAVRAGETGIILSAACRQSRPPCMLPDFLVQVRMEP